jgi:hypothetical protein
MYGLPKDFDGRFLVGHILEIVCFAQHQVCLHFAEKIIITIMSTFSYGSDSIVDMPIHESDLMRLLGLSVSSAVGDENGTLSILFSDGKTLRVYDASKQYESYLIAYDGKEIIV